LRGAIYSGDLKAGSRIRLRDTAKLLGVSEMPVRDALRLLEGDRLVTLRARSGARVTELSSADIEELYAMRAGLEGLAARLAVERMDSATSIELERLFESMRAAWSAGDGEAFIAQDRLFHRTLYEQSGRPHLVARILDLWGNSRRAMPIGYGSWLSKPEALESHRVILSAVLARNPLSAERFLRDHTDQAARRILASLEAPDRRRKAGKR
jgi:DNA-binding GntR family transcriptional regulator